MAPLITSVVTSHDQKTKNVNDQKSNDYFNVSVTSRGNRGLVLIVVLLVLGVAFLVLVAVVACHYFYYH